MTLPQEGAPCPFAGGTAWRGLYASSTDPAIHSSQSVYIVPEPGSEYLSGLELVRAGVGPRPRQGSVAFPHPP